MKKIILLIISLLLVVGCGKDSTKELVCNKPHNETDTIVKQQVIATYNEDKLENIEMTVSTRIPSESLATTYMNTLKEKGIDQKEFVACKAIVGDPSDNIPSACFQVGEKTALGLYKLYCKCVETSKSFPVDEKQLEECSKLFDIPKRKAYLNFNENQFLTNVLLMDLKLVENDITDEVLTQIFFSIKDREQYSDYTEANKILEELSINTFNTSGLINNINRTKPYIFIDSYNPNENIPDKTNVLTGRLF